MLSLCGCQTPAQHRMKILHPWVPEFYPVSGLGSGGRLLRHFQTPTLHWIKFSLRFLERTPTPKQLPHFAVYECLKAFFSKRAFVQCTDRLSTTAYKETPDTPSWTRCVFKTRARARFDTRVSV